MELKIASQITMFVLIYLCIRDLWESSSRSAIVSSKAFAVPSPAVPSFSYRASMRFVKLRKYNLRYIWEICDKCKVKVTSVLLVTGLLN